MDEEEKRHVDPQAEMLGTADCIGEFDLRDLAAAEKLYGRRRAGTRWVDFMAERLEEPSFDVLPALQTSSGEQIQAYLSQKVRVKIWTVNEVGTKYQHLKW